MKSVGERGTKWCAAPASSCTSFVACACACAAVVGCAAPARLALTTTEAATGLVQITRSDTNERDPAVSPDGASLAYEVAASPNAPPHVVVMSLAGAGEGDDAPRIEFDSGAVVAKEPAWMPDGSGIVFVTRGNDYFYGLSQTMGASIDKTAFSAKAGNPIFSSEWPSMAPDGRTVAVSLSHVHVVETGWKARALQKFDQAIALSDLEGTGMQVLGRGAEPAWSPDGARIAFARLTDGRVHVFVANADGSAAQQVTDGPADDQHPSWSPDGKYIAYCSVRTSDEGATQREANLFAVRSDGSGLVQLTEGDRYTCRPDWSRDGFIYFHSDVTDRFHIWRVRPASRGLDGGGSGSPA